MNPATPPKPRAPYEAKSSPWACEASGGKGKHFVFTFKGAVFECVADDYGSETLEEDDDAVRLMSRRLYK